MTTITAHRQDILRRKFATPTRDTSLLDLKLLEWLQGEVIVGVGSVVAHEGIGSMIWREGRSEVRVVSIGTGNHE